MASYCYRVETSCAAIVREVWAIRSAHPLSHAEMADVIARQGAAEVLVRCREDEMSIIEAPRAIVCIEPA